AMRMFANVERVSNRGGRAVRLPGVQAIRDDVEVVPFRFQPGADSIAQLSFQNCRGRNLLESAGKTPPLVAQPNQQIDWRPGLGTIAKQIELNRQVVGAGLDCLVNPGGHSVEEIPPPLVESLIIPGTDGWEVENAIE